jgi:hypothetical protein
MHVKLLCVHAEYYKSGTETFLYLLHINHRTCSACFACTFSSVVSAFRKATVDFVCCPMTGHGTITSLPDTNFADCGFDTVYRVFHKS